MNFDENFRFFRLKKTFFSNTKKIILKKNSKKKVEYSFDAEIDDLSIAAIFRAIRVTQAALEDKT